MVSEQRVQDLIDQALSTLGDSLRAGGSNQLPGFDPDYQTHPLRQTHTMPTDAVSVDGESQFPIAAGQTKQFRFIMNNKTPDGVYGVAINTPPNIGANSSAFILQVINGTTRARALTNDGDFNRSVGRFNTGALVVEGVIENGPTPGLVKIAYGQAESEDDLNINDKHNADADLVTGDATITFTKAGRYIVTWLVQE